MTVTARLSAYEPCKQGYYGIEKTTATTRLGLNRHRERLTCWPAAKAKGFCDPNKIVLAFLVIKKLKKRAQQLQVLEKTAY